MRVRDIVPCASQVAATVVAAIRHVFPGWIVQQNIWVLSMATAGQPFGVADPPVTQTVYLSPQSQPFVIDFVGPYCLPPVVLPVTGADAPVRESLIQSRQGRIRHVVDDRHR